MAKPNSILVFGLLAGGAYALWRMAESSVKELSAKVARVKVNTSLKKIIDLRALDLDLTLDITNPTRNNHEIESFTGQVLYEGIKIADIASRSFTIAANMVTPVVLNFQVNTRTVIDKLVNAWAGGTPISEIQIMGVIKTESGIQVPINQTVPITI